MQASQAGYTSGFTVTTILVGKYRFLALCTYVENYPCFFLCLIWTAFYCSSCYVSLDDCQVNEELL